MKPLSSYSRLELDDVFWSVLRYIRSIKGIKKQGSLIDMITTANQLLAGATMIDLPENMNRLLQPYLVESDKQLDESLKLLRSEAEALSFCKTLGIEAGVTRTQSADHAQSSKSLDSAASHIASIVADDLGLESDVNPQGRVVLSINGKLHVSARRIDGAIPGIANPLVIWENKEYWGGGKGKQGGSKMSDAVYECHLVGLEIRHYESIANCKVFHLVCIDGREQWNARKSDLRRLIDLLNQGYIDELIVGKEIESQFELALRSILAK